MVDSSAVGDYRDELTAAHHRITDLEAKIAAREVPPPPTSEPHRFTRRRALPGWTILVGAAVAGAVASMALLCAEMPDDGPMTPTARLYLIAFIICTVFGSVYGGWASTR